MKHFTDIKENVNYGMDHYRSTSEQMPFEEVDYWKELTEIMGWTEKHVTSTIFLCWAAQASLYYFMVLRKNLWIKKKCLAFSGIKY